MNFILFLVLLGIFLAAYDADKYRVYGNKKKAWWEMTEEESAEYWRNLHIEHYGTEPSEESAMTTKGNTTTDRFSRFERDGINY